MLGKHLQKPVDPNLCWAFLSLFSPSTLDWSHKHGFTGICRCWLSHQPTTDLQSRRQEHEILTVWFEICVPFVSEFIEFWFRYNFWFHLLAIETNLTRGICLSAKKFQQIGKRIRKSKQNKNQRKKKMTKLIGFWLKRSKFLNLAWNFDEKPKFSFSTFLGKKYAQEKLE